MLGRKDKSKQIEPAEPYFGEGSENIDSGSITIEKLSTEEIVNGSEAKVKKKEDVVSLPKQLLIGFYANVKLSDLKSYLYAKALNNMALENAFYGIQRFENGYLWELQEGGSGKGVLSSVVKILKYKNELIIPTDERAVRVIKKGSGGGISSFVLNDDDDVITTDGIEYKESLKPVKSSGFGAFMVSLVFCGVGVLAACSTLIFKYGLYHQPEPLKFVVTKVELPVTQMDAVSYVLQDPDSYLAKLTYKKGQGWSMDKNKEEKEIPVNDGKTDEERQLDILREKMNIKNAESVEGGNNE